MKKFSVLTLILIIVLITSCTLLDDLFDSTGISSGTISTSTGFDLDNGIAYDDASDPNVDIILEPWYKDGVPAPALQLISWGDSTTFIFDLGVISITDAANKSESELIPDSIEWDIYVETGHTYYIITPSLNEFFVYVRKLNINEDNNGYDATMDFDYMQKQ